MEHSVNFNKVEYYYTHKMWNINRVRAAVGKWITEDEFKEITGNDY